MSFVSYREEIKPWGIIRRYEIYKKDSAISLYERFFVERESRVVQPAYSYSDPKIYSVIKGKAVVSLEKYKLELREGEMCYIPPKKRHELFASQGTIVDVIGLNHVKRKIPIVIPQKVSLEKLEKDLKVQLPITI